MTTFEDLKELATERALDHILIELDPWITGADKQAARADLRPFVEMAFDAGAAAMNQGRERPRAK